MYKLTTGVYGRSQRILERLPWFRRLLQYSFVFFLVKGLLWTAVLGYPLVKGLSQL